MFPRRRTKKRPGGKKQRGEDKRDKKPKEGKGTKKGNEDQALSLELKGSTCTPKKSSQHCQWLEYRPIPFVLASSDDIHQKTSHPNSTDKN